MEKEIKINGYRCNFIDNAEEPECEFLYIPIVHDVKYIKSWATISFTPEEKATFGKRIHVLDSCRIPSIVPSKAITIFVFTYQEGDDIEFIKRNAQFFFKEKKDVPTTEDRTSESKKSELKLRLYNYGYNKLQTVKAIKDYFNMGLKETKESIDSISIRGSVNYDLSKLSETKMQALLADLRLNNVRYSII